MPDLAPRSTTTGIVAVWILAALAALAVGTVVPAEVRGAWMPLAFAGCVFASFAVQLFYGRSVGFLVRVAIGAVGSLLVMGLIGVGLGLAALFAG
jgi:hypothetical protein